MKASLLFVLSFSVSSLFAQEEVEWFQPGQEWYYRIHCLQSIDCGYVHFSVEGSEFLAGHEAAVLSRTELPEGYTNPIISSEYLRYANDTVWRYSSESEEWHMIYDFGAEPGDIWTIQDNVFHGYIEPGASPPLEPSDIPLFKVVVDSVAFLTEIPGYPIQNRRVIYTSPVAESAYSYGSPEGIMEGIGPVGVVQDLLGMSSTVPIANYEARFQCFIQNGALQFGTSSSPCYTLGISEVEGVDQGLLYPNPAAETIFWDESFDEIRVFDALGKRVLRKNQMRNFSTLSVAELETGLYIVVIRRDEAVFSQKLMIQ